MSGRVQGVGFRWQTRAHAQALGLTGWVRNCADGSVEVQLEGPAGAVAEMTSWLERGPPAARVESLRRVEALPSGLEGFEIRTSRRSGLDWEA